MNVSVESETKQTRTILYLTDEAGRGKGHTVLCLPVAHCEFNPIEVAWASESRDM